MAPLTHRLYLSTAVCNDDGNQVRSIISSKRQSSATDIGCSDAFAKVITLDRKRFLNLLLRKGSRVVGHGKADPFMHTVIAKMEWSSVLNNLVSLGVRISDTNCNGDTALHLAFLNGAANGAVELLLTKYLKETIINVENNDGLNFMHIASTRPTLTHVQALMDRGIDNINCQVNLRKRTKYAGYTPLHFAVLFGRYEIVRLLLRSGANMYIQDLTGSTPLHLALYNADKRIIDLLFAYDQRKENCTNNFGLTHFMAACAGSMPHIVIEFLYERSMAYQRVISRVRDLQDLPYAGYSPIHFAAEFGNLNTVQILLDCGASCYSMTTDNWSAMAVARHNGHEDILVLLQMYSIRDNEVFFITHRRNDDHERPNF